MNAVLDDIERNRLGRMLSGNKWVESEGDVAWAGRLLWDFGFMHSPREMEYFMEHPLKREFQLREILEMK